VLIGCAAPKLAVCTEELMNGPDDTVRDLQENNATADRGLLFANAVLLSYQVLAKNVSIPCTVGLVACIEDTVRDLPEGDAMSNPPMRAGMRDAGAASEAVLVPSKLPYTCGH